MTGALVPDVELLESVLESISDVVLIVDREGVIRYINRVEKGYDRDEVIGSQVDAILVPESKKVARAALAAAIDDGEEREFEVEVSAPDGSAQWYRSTMSPLMRDGEIIGGLIRTENVTELKESEKLAADLRRLLPMCSWCDRIMDDQGQWETIESYVKRHEGAAVTHGMCPDCYGRQVAASDEAGGNGGSAA